MSCRSRGHNANQTMNPVLPVTNPILPKKNPDVCKRCEYETMKSRMDLRNLVRKADTWDKLETFIQDEKKTEKDIVDFIFSLGLKMK